MGAAYYIVLERKIDNLDTGMDGKSLAKHIEALDKAAKKLGVRRLSDFVSADPGDMADFFDAESSDEFPALEQFAAEEGLATLRALAADPTAKKEDVAEDLRACERILIAAAQHGVRWHLEIDI